MSMRGLVIIVVALGGALAVAACGGLPAVPPYTRITIKAQIMTGGSNGMDVRAIDASDSQGRRVAEALARCTNATFAKFVARYRVTEYFADGTSRLFLVNGNYVHADDATYECPDNVEQLIDGLR